MLVLIRIANVLETSESLNLASLYILMNDLLGQN